MHYGTEHPGSQWNYYYRKWTGKLPAEMDERTKRLEALAQELYDARESSYALTVLEADE